MGPPSCFLILQRERREKAVARAQPALDKARREYEQKAEAIAAECAAVDERAQAEEGRWEKLKTKLEAALRRARFSHHQDEKPTPPLLPPLRARMLEEKT